VLASVAFAIVSKPAAGTTVLSLSNVKITDPNGVSLGVTNAPTTACSPLPTVGCGQQTITIGNNPPHASFTVSHTGTSYTFTDTSTDADAGDTPRYRIWDFGDKSPILNTTATTAVHDYGLAGSRAAPGLFNVTLRVVDNQGDTSAARDSSGGVIVNQDPQHTFNNLGLVEVGPTSSFTFSPSSGITTTTSVTFDGSGSSYPDEPILAGTAPVGGTALTSSNAGDATCLTITGIPCPVGFVDNNANGVFDPGVDTVVRSRDLAGASMCNAGACDILAGPAITPAGQTIILDGKISWWDTNANGIVDPTEPVIYDTNGNHVYDGIKTYSWNFGDGNTATGITVSHTFSGGCTGGTCTVTLTVTDNFGRTASSNKPVR